jgi:hypothetical protein
VLPRQRDFIASLAQFGLDILKAQSLVDGGFRFGRHDGAAFSQALIAQLQSFRFCDASELLQMRLRSCRPQEARAKMLRIGQVDRQFAELHDLRAVFQVLRFHDECEIRNQLAPSAEIARAEDALQMEGAP